MSSDVDIFRRLRALEEQMRRLKAMEAPRLGIGARAYNNAAITVSHNTATALTLNSERYDTDGYHSTSADTGRLTVPTGYGARHLIIAQARFTANSTGFRQVYIRLNGGTVIDSATVDAVATSETEINVATIYDLSEGDYVEMVVFQTSGGNLDVLSSGNWSPEFMIARLG